MSIYKIEMKIIPEVICEDKNIQYIYHISDIHIRRYDRHNEYEYVFNKLYSYLGSVEKGLIVITGDILHNKDNLTPNCINKTRVFLESLGDIMPVIMIAGNHDIVENNVGIRDSLKSIIDGRDYKNIFYLETSGVYVYGNIKFCVFSLIDKIIFNPIDIDRDDNDIIIGLYHGGVGETVNSVGHKLKGDKVVDDFNGCDYVLLGDIHKHQFVAPNMAYASSLISQNYGECDDEHGVLVWDIFTGKTEYKIIKNKYRYMMLELDNDNEIDINIEKCARLKLCINNCSEDFVKKINKKIKKKYKNVSINESYIGSKVIESKVIQEKISYVDMLDKFMKGLIKEDKDKIIKLFNDNLKESLQNEKQLAEWTLLKLEFSNMFGYGENNVFDFTHLPENDIAGLFAQNSFGKSSLIDIILFTLFENFSRNQSNRYGTIPSYIVNSKCKWFETKLSFKLGENIYYIHKKGKLVGKVKSKTGKSIKFEFTKFYYEYDGKVVDLTGVDRMETQKEVIKVIGDYDEFCMTSLFLQVGEKSFYQMSSSDRKVYLYNLLQLGKFTGMKKKFNDILKKNKTLQKEISGELLTVEEIIELENNIDSKKIDEYKLLLDNIREKLNIYNREKERLLLLIDGKIVNSKVYGSVDDMKHNVFILEKINSYYAKNIFTSEFDIELLEKCKISIDVNIVKEYEQYLINKKKVEDYNYKINILEEQLKNNEINRDCEICMKRIDIITKIENDISKNKIKRDKIFIDNDIVNKYNKMIKYVEEYNNNIDKRIKMINNNNDNDIINLLPTINIINDSIKYVQNHKIINKINKVKKIINKLKEDEYKYNNEYIKLVGEVERNKMKLEKANNDIKKNSKYLEEIKIYNVLVKATHINGIPSMILDKYVSLISDSVNDKISKFINREIEIILDGSNLVINTINNGEVVNIVGGMERFIIDIAFKISLASFSILPKSYLLIIDESISVLDKEHIDKFHIIISFLKKYYRNIILISHIDSLKDFISYFIDINKVDGNSKINY
jgi:DNA repair exonuclease SbcCD ATPase subunit